MMEYVLGVLAAALLGVAFVLQQEAAQQAPEAHFLRIQLLADLLHRPRWIAGVITMVAGQVLSAWVIGHMVLSLVEPLIATSLLFALLLAGPLSGQAVHKTEVAGALILMAGVAALSLARSVPAPAVYVGSYAYWPLAGAVVAFLAAVFAGLGLRHSAGQRAILTGTSAGLVFGIADAITRRTVQMLDTHHLAALLTTWLPYALVAVSLVGIWLMESAFNAAPLHSSLPGITAAEPVAGIVLGIVVFRDSVRVSAGDIALEICGVIALLLGVIMVARAPALARLRRIHLPHLPLAGTVGAAAQHGVTQPVEAVEVGDSWPEPGYPQPDGEAPHALP
jgi:hypothetical protein